jgi:hypothetical protein
VEKGEGLRVVGKGGRLTVGKGERVKAEKGVGLWWKKWKGYG